MTMETWKRAQNLQVATLEEGALVGRLDDFQFDLETLRIYGWRLKSSGMFGRSGGVRASEMNLIGRDLAFVRTEAAVEWTSGKPAAVGGRAWASSYRGTTAITRRGRSLGTVQDYVIDRTGQQVTGLILHGGALLPLDGRVNTGPAAVIVESEDLAVQLPEDEGDERTDWWNRLREAVGGKDDKAPGKDAAPAPTQADAGDEAQPAAPESDEPGQDR
jgi:sporulation protein YlmC with PRC-barrel domain